ncbi:Helix-turn-helix domain-containing protein [Pricia antarctica]|uniref:Helix-turn-helix domain-containing protein n=1 Tax=Pricia antarctica TaxID=641691 RepID=A0A1G7JF38_9FLAO|nr:helix-turn-helix domain-containing protein [Pricia antarctica]SDF23521.1 Helix-turn-helix domain-containing protein [Pricia antarctica]
MQKFQFIPLPPEKFDETMALIKEVKNQLKYLQENFQPKIPTEYLTRHEVASLLKVDISSVHNYTKRGLLQSYALSGRVYYKRSEVEGALVKLQQKKG